MINLHIKNIAQLMVSADIHKTGLIDYKNF